MRRVLSLTFLVLALAVTLQWIDCSGTGGAATGTSSHAAAAKVPASNHVVMVVEENHGYSQLVGNPAMPYLNSLIGRYALATNYYANTHPSIGNYFMLTTGQELTNDDSRTPANFPVADDNLVRQMQAAGKSWKAYAEGLPAAGYTGPDFYPYLVSHNPFAYFVDVQSNPAQTANLVPFTQFATDLAAGRLPNFSFIVPDVTDDGHDCPAGMGTCADNAKLIAADQWLQTNIAPLLNDPGFQQDGILMIVFDESEDSDVAEGGGHVAWVVVGPGILPGYQSAINYQHANTLRLVCDALGIAACPGAAASAATMGEFFAAPKH